MGVAAVVPFLADPMHEVSVREENGEFSGSTEVVNKVFVNP